MPSIKIYNQTGAETGTLELNETVFGVEYNEALIHQVVVAQQNNKRQGTKSTLTRTEVRGGGIKPWRQKGTGRARQGSIRSPQWVGGGVVFAPKPRDFDQKINKKANRKAICSALSAKLADENMIVVDKIALTAPKTKEELLQRYTDYTNLLLDNPQIMGLCYTQLYDVEQEQNGLYTYDRRPKLDMEKVKAVNTRKAAIEKL